MADHANMRTRIFIDYFNFDLGLKTNGIDKIRPSKVT